MDLLLFFWGTRAVIFHLYFLFSRIDKNKSKIFNLSNKKQNMSNDPNIITNNEQYLLIITFVVSIISLLGSLFIILTYLFVKRLRNFAFKLVVYLSISDVILTIGNMLVSDQFDDSESDTICFLQAILTNYGGLASILWTSIIAFTIYSTVVNQRKNINTSQTNFILFGYGIPLLLSIL